MRAVMYVLARDITHSLHTQAETSVSLFLLRSRSCTETQHVIRQFNSPHSGSEVFIGCAPCNSKSLHMWPLILDYFYELDDDVQMHVESSSADI